jgi:hypothetical protein
MPANNGHLDAIDIASPCSANWDEMAGDDRQRFCQECQLNVFNLSGMTAAAATQLLQESEGRLCVRLFRRDDGKVLTADCPVGWAAVRRRARLAKARLVAVLAVLSASLLGCWRRPAPGVQPVPPVQATPPVQVSPPAQAPLMGDIAVKMGEVCPPQDQVWMGRIQIAPPATGADPVERDPVERDPIERDPAERDPVEHDPIK